MATFFLSHMSEISIIITAGGIGSRMGHTLPKQFISLGDKPIIVHTFERFLEVFPHAEYILTLPENWINHWLEIQHSYLPSLQVRVIKGGTERYHSIKNALEICSGQWVMIHDAVRPFPSDHTLSACLKTMKEKGNAVPVLPIKESLRHIEGSESHAVDRSAFFGVQTPQCFTKELILQAYEQPFSHLITDDASLVEAMGVKIHLVEGNEENLKVTTPFDLEVAELLLAKVKV